MGAGEVWVGLRRRPARRRSAPTPRARSVGSPARSPCTTSTCCRRRRTATSRAWPRRRSGSWCRRAASTVSAVVADVELRACRRSWRSACASPSGRAPTGAGVAVGRGQAGDRDHLRPPRQHNATVIEVRAPDTLGLLHRLTVRAAPNWVWTCATQPCRRWASRPSTRSTFAPAAARSCSRNATGRGRTSADACRRVEHVTDASPADFTRDLVRWSETLAAIARTGLGFTAEPVRARAVRRGAARRRRHQGRRRRGARGAPRAGPLRPGVDGVRRRGRARLRHARRSRSARSSATTPARCCSSSGPTAAIWLYPTGWADVGYSPAEVAVKEVLEETGIECEPVQLLSVVDGQRMGFTRFGMYMIAVPLPRDRRRRCSGHPLETAGVGWFGRDALPARHGRRRVVGRRWRSPRSTASSWPPPSNPSANRSGEAEALTEGRGG